MSDDKRYNGWTNYETWNVKLWMDEGSYRYWQEASEEVWDDSEYEHEFLRKMSNRLFEEFSEAQPEVTGMWADLLGAALSKVNWYEIAESFVGDLPAKEQEDEEEDEEENSQV